MTDSMAKRGVLTRARDTRLWARTGGPAYPRAISKVAAFAIFLQLTLPGLATLAESSTVVPFGATSHVEESTSGSCPVAHPLDCAVCIYFTVSAEHPAHVTRRVDPGTSEVVAKLSQVVQARVARELPRPRAPPRFVPDRTRTSQTKRSASWGSGTDIPAGRQRQW